MTQEEKLAEAKRLYQTANADQKYVLECLFPGLAESEDERIRKEIHIYLDWLDGRKDYAPKGIYSIKDMIAWLEKQDKKLEPDKVIEWLECDAFQSWGEPIDIRPIIRKFKKDFEL